KGRGSAGEVADDLVARIPQAATGPRSGDLLAVDAQLHGRIGDAHAGRGDVQVDQLVAVADVRAANRFLRHERDQVLVVDRLLCVGEALEGVEEAIHVYCCGAAPPLAG